MCPYKFQKHFSLNWLGMKMRYRHAQFDKMWLISVETFLNLAVKQYHKTKNGQHKPKNHLFVTADFTKKPHRFEFPVTAAGISPFQQQAGSHNSGFQRACGLLLLIPEFYEHNICICNISLNSRTKAVTQPLRRKKLRSSLWRCWVGL